MTKITEHAPKDETLRRIAKGLAEVQRRHFYRIEARTEHSGHYSHSGCTRVSVWVNGEDASAEVEQEITDLLRCAMDWVYSRLEAENDWLLADEQVDEAIRANEYEFNEDGRLA